MDKLYKRISLCVCALTLLIASHTSSAQKIVKENYVMLRGTVTEYDDEPLYNASIAIYIDTVLFSTEYSGHDGRCRIKLPLDNEFTLVFFKEGFVTKKVVINTFVPGSVKDIFKFNFRIDLFERIEGLDTSILNDPLARIAYDLPKREFGYNENHSVTINRQIEKLYREHYLMASESGK
jgi:hypothetical protein